VLCSPHNPVGRVHNPDELAALVRLARIYRVAIVSDEIHAPLVLPGATFTPLLAMPGAADVAVSVVSASKGWNLAGTQVRRRGHRVAADGGVVGRLPHDLRWRSGHFGVIASIAAFTDGEPWLDQVLGTLDARRAQLGELLRERLQMIGWQPPEANLSRVAGLREDRARRRGPARSSWIVPRRAGTGPALRRRRGRIRAAQLRHQRGDPRRGDETHGRYRGGVGAVRLYCW
jgi:aspartate/methionine/tyrosine aminotransferase